jgi:hypothetical protein
MKNYAAVLLLMTGCPEDDDATGDDSGASETSAGGEESAGEESAGEESAGEESAGEESAGEESAGEESAGEESAGEESSGGAAAAAILGHLTREESATLADGNDGIGTLYVGVFDGCDETAMLANFAVMPGADVSTTDAVVDFTIDGLEPGEYDVRVFLDDNEDAVPTGPAPGPGDLAADPDLTDAGPTCNPVTVDGTDVDVDVALNFSVPAK